jgi:hypothetical protein
MASIWTRRGAASGIAGCPHKALAGRCSVC